MSEMEQLINQVRLLTTKVQEQEAIINTSNLTRFKLSASQVIKNFNDIKQFSGEDNYKLKSFFKAVENAELLCGEHNEELKEYCLRLVVNSKIIGKARNAILEIPENLRNWTTVVNTLTLRFKPKYTIHQLLFQAKEIKVFNLKDTFNKLTTIKSDISEICDFDNNSTFTYESIDKELVLTLKSKLIPMLQIQINENKTLFELDNEFCASEIYLSTEVIKPNYKLNSRFEKDKNNIKVVKQEKIVEKPINNKPYLTQNKPLNNTGQFKQNFNKYSGNNSGQFKPNSGQFKNKVEQMEIDNLVESENEDNDELENECNDEIEINENEIDEIDEEVNFH